MDQETRIATILAGLKGVRRSSGGYMALCPAHGDTNLSLGISRGNDGRILLHCFGSCTVKDIMSALGLPMKMLTPNISNQLWKSRGNIQMHSTPKSEDEGKIKNAHRLYVQAASLSGTPGADYLHGRGIPVQLANANGAKYHSKYPFKNRCAPAVVFPIYSGDRSGKFVGLNARFLHPDRDTDGEKQRSAGKPSLGVFGTCGAVDLTETVIAEAPIDALSLAAAGIPGFATCGASNLRLFPQLYGAKTVICAFDLDAEPATQARIKTAMDRLKDEHAGRVVWLKPPGNGLKDWNDILRNYGSDGLAHYLRQAGAKCKPPILIWLDPKNVVEPTVADSGGHVNCDIVERKIITKAYVEESSAIPNQPAKPCYCCKSRKWWFQEVSRSWVCSICHPDPRPIRNEG